MRFVIEKQYRGTPTQVWPLIAIPERMSEWSSAPIRSRALGDQGRPETTGALRTVEIAMLGRRTSVLEVVARCEPPFRHHYRLISGYPIEGHRAEIELTADGTGGTNLRWSVAASIGGGLDGLITKQIHGALSRSLDSLGDFIGAETALVELTPIESVSDVLWAESRAVLSSQRARADELAAHADPQQWFARIYSIVTEELLKQAARGDIVHPAWLLRLIPIFERYYADNLAAYRTGDGARLESHWARAFRVAERARTPDGIGPALFHGIRAHVEGDLGRSLAEVHHRFYADDVDYVRFRADYLAMNAIFRSASETMFERVPKGAVPRWFRAARRLLPHGLLDRVRDRSFYDMPARRRAAFEDGLRISRLLDADHGSRTQPPPPR